MDCVCVCVHAFSVRDYGAIRLRTDLRRVLNVFNNNDGESLSSAST